MKKLLAALLAVLLLLPVTTVFAEGETLSPAQEALIAYAEAMLARGNRVQYDDTLMVNSNSGELYRWQKHVRRPEDYTAQDPGYTICGVFAQDIYYFALDYDIGNHKTETLIKVNDKTCVFHYEITGSETDAEKAAIQKQFFETLRPCDLIIHRLKDETNGHAMFHVGDGTIIHSTSSLAKPSYDYAGRAERYEKSGSIAIGSIKRYFEPDYRRYVFGGTVGRLTVLRPLNAWNGEVPEQSRNRVANLRGVMVEKLCSKTVGQTVEPGEELTYTIRIRNDNAQAVTLAVKDFVPAHTTFLSGCDAVNGTELSWTAAVPAGETVDISYTVRVDADAVRIVSDRATVGGVTCKCPDVWIGKHLTDAEKEKLTQAAAAASSAEQVYETALGMKLPAPQELFSSLFAPVKGDAKSFRLSDLSPYYPAVAPTMYGGRAVVPGTLFGSIRTHGPYLNQLEVGDLVYCTDSPDASDCVTMLIAGQDAVLTSDGALLTGDDAQKALWRAISYQRFVVLRPAALADQTVAAPAEQKAAFPDAAEIDLLNTEAVEVLSRLRVLAGFPDGSFRPAETLTRAQAAKILCCVLLGEKGADALRSGGAAFSDVPASHWANKYVEYCAANRIVAGVGGGKYDPDGLLTGHAFGKMLLAALGQDTSGFVGTGWDAKVEAQLAAKHLDRGVRVTGGKLDRQSACRLALNALFCGEENDPASTLAYKVFGVRRELTGSALSDYRRPVVSYASEARNAYWPGSELDLTASPSFIHENGPITGDAFVRALGVTDLSYGQIAVYRGGVQGNLGNKSVKDVWHLGNENVYYLSDNGIRLEVYYDALRNTCTVLHIPTFCRKITAVTEPVLAADGSVQTPGSVTFEELSPFASDAFKASDVGSYGLVWGRAKKTWSSCVEAFDVSRGTVVAGTLTAYDGKSVTVDGKTYSYPHEKLVARSAEAFCKDGGKSGDTVNLLRDDVGLCYAVWN